MIEFAYNDTKITSIRYMLFELNYGYYPYISYKQNVNPYSRSKTANKLTRKLKNPMVICRKSL